MKELAKYTGKVIELLNPPKLSYVTLKELATGKAIEASAVSEKLIAANLKTGDEFEVVVQQSDGGQISGVIRKLNPIELTEKDQTEISNINIGGGEQLGFKF